MRNFLLSFSIWWMFWLFCLLPFPVASFNSEMASYVLWFSCVLSLLLGLVTAEFLERRSYEKFVRGLVQDLENEYRSAVAKSAEEVFLFLVKSLSQQGYARECILVGRHKEKLFQGIKNSYSCHFLENIVGELGESLPKGHRYGNVLNRFCELLVAFRYPFKFKTFLRVSVTSLDGDRKGGYFLPKDLEVLKISLSRISRNLETLSADISQEIKRNEEKQLVQEVDSLPDKDVS